MLVLVGIGFVAGFVTAVSPCVLPVLPILLAGGASGRSRRRPYEIIAGLVGSFTLFTLAGAWLLDALGLPQDFLRNVAIGLLLLLAATLVIPRLATLVERPFLPLTRRRPGSERNGVVLGASLGLVFVPCAGPVLAAMTAVAASGQVGTRTVAVTLAYAAGAAVPMLLFAIGGQRLAQGLTFLRRHALATRRLAGIVLGATAIAIAFGVDQRFTTALPGYTQAVQDRVERSSLASRELRKLTRGDTAEAAPASEDAGRTAPEFRGIVDWLNTPGGRPLSIEGLRGKVVLIDFWTYSCINCLRTLPHVKAWDRAYRKAGLVIVGVHSPEFAFERVPSNVEAAVEKLGVEYPVALDNGYATWNAYQNQYWPAKYLIDRSGRVRYTHFGEGEYERTETTIRSLLGEHARSPMTEVADRTPDQITTPESYLGYLRLDRFAGGPIVHDREARYRFPSGLSSDELAYAGRWRVESQRIVAGRSARLRMRFTAQHVYLVLGGSGRVDVLVDAQAKASVRIAGEPRLYTLVDLPRLEQGLLELRFSPGLSAYAFTFG
jgi:cytochrome c biogenesis protein CcdA/thiol-disulfide isomerase/thioredoxin